MINWRRVGLMLEPREISSIFQDTSLAKVVVSELGKTSVEDKVVQAELDAIKILMANNKHVTTLNGLENLRNLTDLYLSDNQISDLTPLISLRRLRNLDFSNNQISDISSLIGLRNLDMLRLSNNQINDISPLEQLRRLSILDLSNNKLDEVTSLIQLGNLESLYLSNNQIMDVSLLSALEKLEILNLSDNKIVDISFLANLKNLGSLNLNHNQISDVSSLDSLKNMPLLKDIQILGQEVSFPTIKWSRPLSLVNRIKDMDGNLVVPLFITNHGTYRGVATTWGKLPNVDQILGYTWRTKLSGGTFSGMVSFNVKLNERALGREGLYF
ncbi:leucine-rich repeat domain-containing protein [Listeria monocytogenes]|uniref:leucine-rich repeat domain-containing protein n=1 Tax=Listeria monocytogenes TaxID=1639 RepID=UPI0011EB9542|nr:leucine-rich repeat domain-containing protein [Listeria monocytogenes]EBF5184245.1 leucine-rich repeat domain-containing protein [Listeria monocytogenes]TYV72876.1 leucine-rich repeat domain-containing protein [Listeria monocytogenes]